MPLRISREGGTTFLRSRMVKMYSPAIGGGKIEEEGRGGYGRGANERAPQRGRPQVCCLRELAEILICDLGQVEHGDLTSVVKQRTELLVGVDGPAILGVLQSVPLDICP